MSIFTAETFETMDESFAELAQLLQFRDKEQERTEKSKARKMGTLNADDVEMDAWDKEMKVSVLHSANVDIPLHF
jgi:nucleolar protein 14